MTDNIEPNEASTLIRKFTAAQQDAPDPGYFEFDDIIAKLPDVYHRFALSTVGAVEGLHRFFDLTGTVVVDIGAGTGRSAVGLSVRAKTVFAVELQPAVIDFAVRELRKSNVQNVAYVGGSSEALPLKDGSVDHAVTAWSVIDHREARRVTRSGGLVFQLGPGPANMCGELTQVLAEAYGFTRPKNPSRDDAWFGDVNSPREGTVEGASYRDIDYVADYGSVDEACMPWARIYGPPAEAYLREREQSGVHFRLRISYYTVS